LVLLLGVIGKALAGVVLLQDDFNDNSLDSSLWTTVTTGPFSSGASIAEQNQRIEMINRGYLVTVQQFDPLTAGPIRITGAWTLDEDPPFRDGLVVVTRSDAIRTSNFGNVNSGIGFSIEEGFGVLIVKFVNGGAAVVASATVGVGAGETFKFEILDDGVNLSFTINEVGGDGTSATITATDATDFASDFVLFFNRERFFPFDVFEAFLDDVKIEVAPNVNIDIKPGSFPNSINPKSRGRIPVASLSTASFDAPSHVNQGFLTFGRTGDEPSLAFCNTNGEDVNGDGLLDLVCHFHTMTANFQSGDTQGILKGKTMSGTPLMGIDSVRIVP